MSWIDNLRDQNMTASANVSIDGFSGLNLGGIALVLLICLVIVALAVNPIFNYLVKRYGRLFSFVRYFLIGSPVTVAIYTIYKLGEWLARPLEGIEPVDWARLFLAFTIITLIGYVAEKSYKKIRLNIASIRQDMTVKPVSELDDIEKEI